MKKRDAWCQQNPNLLDIRTYNEQRLRVANFNSYSLSQITCPVYMKLHDFDYMPRMLKEKWEKRRKYESLYGKTRVCLSQLYNEHSVLYSSSFLSPFIWNVWWRCKQHSKRFHYRPGLFTRFNKYIHTISMFQKYILVYKKNIKPIPMHRVYIYSIKIHILQSYCVIF